MGKREMVRLGDVADFNMGQSPSSESYNDVGEGMPFYQGKSDFGLIFPTARMYCTDPKKVAKKNDILMSVRAPVGAVNIATETCCIGRGLTAISQKDSVSVYKYLYYFFQYKERDIANMGVGSTFKAISKKDLDSIQIPLPTLPIQQQIADILDRASALIEKRKAQIDKLDLLVKSQFVEMFGDPVTNPMGWEKKSLAKECDVITGNTPSRKKPENYGDYIEWIKSDNINTPDMYLTKASENLSEIGLSVGRCVDAGAILMTCIAGSVSCIGNVAISDRKVSFNQQINAVVPKANDTYFLYYLFLLSKPYIQSTISMSLKGILSKGKMLELEFPFPTIDSQKQFGRFVHKVEAQKQLLQNSLAKLELQYKSLMQKCFRGDMF